MKPDSEDVFYESSLVCQHDSRLLKQNNSEFDIDGQKTTGKENENQDGVLCDLKDSGRVADSLASQMKATDGILNSPELECSVVVDDSTKGVETEVQYSVTPCNTPSRRSEFEETFFKTKKRVNECEKAELIVCYGDSTFHVVKDICIDEGVPPKDKILTEHSKNEHKDDSIFRPYYVGKNCDGTKGKVDMELLMPEKENDCNKDAAGSECGTEAKVDIELPILSSSEIHSEKDASNKCVLKDLIWIDELNCNTTNNILDDILREKSTDSMFLVQEVSMQETPKSVSDSSDHSGDEDKQLPGQIPCAEAILETHAVVSASEEADKNKDNPATNLFYDSKVENGTITFDFDSSIAAARRKDNNKNIDCEQRTESKNVPKLEDGTSDCLSVASQVPYCYGESSFSEAGPISGLVSFSGHVAYSGSVSVRSDSSTTSNRSFAFPILQSEWNSSPIRMAKADRRHLQRHRGWKQSLLCCRF